MTAVFVKRAQFSGESKVASREVDGLAAIVRGLAIDNAIAKLQVAAVSAVTDSTTGTAAIPPTMGGDGALPLVNLIAPTGVYNAVSAGGVLTTALTTSVAKTRNAIQGWVSVINNMLARLGVANLQYAEGSLGTFGTIVAQDLSCTTGAGALAVSYASYVAQADAIMNAQYNLMFGMNQCLAAIGAPVIANAFGSEVNLSKVIGLIPAAVDSATGSDSVLLADGTAFLAAVANNFASLASAYNEFFTQGATPGTLTDSTGGASGVLTIAEVAVVAPVGYQDVSGASLPTAGTNTLIDAYQNALSSILAKINLYREKNDLAALVDNIGGTVSTTLASEASTVAVAAGIKAVGTITEATTTNFINGDIMTIGNQSFSFITTLGTTPGQIQVRANTAAGFAATMADVIASMASTVRGLAGISAGVYVPNTAVPDTVVASLVPNAGGGATFSVTALVDGVGGNSLVFTNTSTHSEVFDGSGVLGGTTTGAAALGASLTTWNATLAAVTANIAYMASQLNAVLGDVGGTTGLQPLIDNSGGVLPAATVAIHDVVTTDNAAVAATNPGATGASGVQNTLAATIQVAISNAMATLAARVTALAGDTWGTGLHVVASQF
jgi:hypothetical protein